MSFDKGTLSTVFAEKCARVRGLGPVLRGVGIEWGGVSVEVFIAFHFLI